MSMVAYARSPVPIDASRIVVSGFSSGAMMTNVLAAPVPPDVFSAASAFSGRPAPDVSPPPTAHSGTASAPAAAISRYRPTVG